jgi:hypothetical protein
MLPDVVAGGNDVHAGIEEFLSGSEGKAAATGGVLAVCNYQLGVCLAAEGGEEGLHSASAQAANDVTHKENLQTASGS